MSAFAAVLQNGQIAQDKAGAPASHAPRAGRKADTGLPTAADPVPSIQPHADAKPHFDSALKAARKSAADARTRRQNDSAPAAAARPAAERGEGKEKAGAAMARRDNRKDSAPPADDDAQQSPEQDAGSPAAEAAAEASGAA